ncbi:MAG: hypothetical protein ACOYBC_01905 [Bilifractor sp.]|jgi:hypothetical protein
MKKRIVISIGSALLAATALCACTKSTTATVKVKNAEVPTLYSVLDEERKLTGQGTSVENGTSTKTLTYGNGDVTQDDAINYINALAENEDFTVVDGSEDENDSSNEIKVGAAKDMGEGKIVVVSADWTMSETTIEYAYGEGTITPNE